MQMLNQEMQNAQESTEAKTQAKLKGKRSSICRSLHCSDPWATNTPNQQIGTTHATKNCKNSDCHRRRIVPGTGITLRQNRSTSQMP